MGSLPSGTVTFLFSDIEGSTKLAQVHADQWEKVRDRHNAILKTTIATHNGHVFQIIGDAYCAAFHTAKDGLAAAILVQQRLQTEDWEGTAIKVRMGIHTGSAELEGNDYRGYLTLVKVQRVMSVAWGGQILLSNASAELLRTELPAGTMLLDLKEHRLKGLPEPEHLWQVTAPGLQVEFPVLQSLNEIPNNLPLQLTAFIGRETEVDQIMKRLEKSRLVTLTGSGGVGKTRLSIQVASEIRSEYPNGVWFIELAPITDPDLVTRTVCSALDLTLQGSTSALQVLTDYLRPKKLLLVMDNCEHLIEECAHICDSLLHECPNLGIIGSSREALGIDGENTYHVPSLSLPDPNSGLSAIRDSEAVRLFVERATAVLPEFELTDSNASSVAQICRRLDGIALAIELAASRVKILKVEQIASRLDDAFRLLTGGSRTALPRQQTLRAMIDWSYNLLSEEERTVLRRLSVFMGGWTLEAAEEVCDNPNMLDLLSHLVDKSLVSVDYEHGEEARYYFLETIRQYAREKLYDSGEGEIMRERQARWCVDLAERADPKLRGHGQLEWLDRIDQEIDNVRSALEWCLDHNIDLGFRIMNGLRWFWGIRDHSLEGIQHMERLMKAGPIDPTLLHAKALATAAWVENSYSTMERMVVLAEAGTRMSREVGDVESLALCIGLSAVAQSWQGNIDQAIKLFEESLALHKEAGNSWGVPLALIGIGFTLLSQDRERALAALLKSLALSRENGDLEACIHVLYSLGNLSFEEDDYVRALNYYQEGLPITQELKDKAMNARFLQRMGEAYILRGQYDQAKTFVEESIAIEQNLANPRLPGFAFELLGRVARLQEDFESARKYYLEGLRLAQKHASLVTLASHLLDLAELAALIDQPKKAVRLFGAAESIPELYLDLYTYERLELEQKSAFIRSQLPEMEFQIEYEAGLKMSPEEAVAYAMKDAQ